MRPATDTPTSQACQSLLSVEETYILTKVTLYVPTNFPHTSSHKDFHLMVVGCVQMTERQKMRPATDTLPSPSPKVEDPNKRKSLLALQS